MSSLFGENDFESLRYFESLAADARHGYALAGLCCPARHEVALLLELMVHRPAFPGSVLFSFLDISYEETIVFYRFLASANLPITILKFGGSVLPGPDALTNAVGEVERTLRAGSRVVAVTSAFSGVTERLLNGARTRFSAPAEKPLASLLATGESRSAAFLALALDDAGVSNELLEPDRIGLTVRGSWLDSEPVDIDVTAVHKALGRAPVIVLPGFFGRRHDGSTALLGRGGSDLTAVFLTHRLSAQACRLIKNVDGLFSHDPSSGTVDPVNMYRYHAASWDLLAAVGGGLVQTKAIEFARKHGVAFTIAAPLSDLGTRVAS